METKSILLIILIMPLYGIGVGLHLDLIDKGEMFHLQDLINNAGLQVRDNSLLDYAFMNANVNGPISSASIDLVLDKVLVDQDGIPNSGDEYFDNLITECSFHSLDDIDPNSCIICKLSDKKIPPEECKDFWIDFEGGLTHGSEHGDIVTYLQNNFGITLTVDGANGLDEAIIYDSRHLGPGDINDNSKNGCDADDEHPLMPGDDPSVGNLLVMRETTNQCGQPNDSAKGGTLTFQLDKPMFLESVDVVDHDNNGESSVIRAYQTADCTGSFVEADIVEKNFERSLQKVVVNADDVLCFEIIYFDSGGFTNIHLRCIPCESAWIDFEGLQHGTEHQDVFDHLKNNFGITLTVDGANGLDEAIIYDSRHLGPGDINDNSKNGCDADDEHPLMPDDLSVGNLLVMRETNNQCGQPNDSGKGGTLTFQLDKPMFLESVDVVDHDNNGETSVIRAYQTADCTGSFVEADIVEFNKERSLQRVFVNANNVSCFEIIYFDSGGFTNIHLTCVQDGLKTEDKWMMGDDANIIAKGTLELPDGYTGSDRLSILLDDGGVDAQKPASVELDVFTNTIPTQGLEFGEIIVADDNTDSIIRIDSDGQQTIISEGGFFRDPENVVIDSDGNILVADGRAAGGEGAIIKVNPVTGDQTILSEGGFFKRGPEDLVIASNGDIFVLDDGDGAVIKVDPVTGDQTLISDNDEFSGRPEGIALEADGMIIVADGNGAKIIRVHPVTGAQTVISSGGELVRPEGVAVAADGSIFVADGNAQDSNTGAMGKIIKVDPLGDQGNPGSAQEVIIDGGPFVDPSDVEILPNGDLIVSDDAGSADGMGAIYQVDPDTKMVTLISSNGISDENHFDSPEGLAVVTLLPPEFVCEKLPPPPPEECPECKKPDIFTVLYNGPDGNEVIISKEGKDPVPFGTFNDGNLIVVDSNIDLGKSTVNPETTYTFSIGGEISIHTSCSQFPPTPHIGQEFFANKGTANEIKLTVFSGTLNGVPSIPDAICLPPPEECPECKRPQFLTVRYDNEAHPNEVVRVEVYKNADEFGDAGKLLAEFDGIMNGDDITIDGSTFGSKNTVESNTAYCILFDSNLSTGLKSSTCVEFHTSCSQPLFVGDVHPGDFGVVITVVSGTDASGNPTIPDASCKPQ